MKAVVFSLIALAGILAIVQINALDRTIVPDPTTVEPHAMLMTLDDANSQDVMHFREVCPLADGFVYPVGPPHAQGYYNAQPFGKNHHLGDDWNGKGGGNTDLGDPIYAIAKGVVFYADKAGPGWGNVIRIYHNIGTHNEPEFVESLYAHLDSMQVSAGDIITQGQQLGTMGNADGQYYAHLHFEIRTTLDMPIGGGYSANTNGFVDPTSFIKSHTIIKRNTDDGLR